MKEPVQLLIEDQVIRNIAVERARKAWLHEHGEQRTTVAHEIREHAQEIRLKALNASLLRAGHAPGQVVVVGDVIVRACMPHQGAEIAGKTLPKDMPDDALDEELRVERDTVGYGGLVTTDERTD